MQTSAILFWTIAGSLITLGVFQYFIYKIIRLHKFKIAEQEFNSNLLFIENEKQLLETKIYVQEEIMEYLSKEIHDNINQILTLAKLNIDSFINDNHDFVKTNLSVSQEYISNAIIELGNLSKSLSADFVLECGLLRSIEMEVERVSKINDVSIIFRAHEEILNPSILSQIAIYRVFQESIKNALTHGKSTEIIITASYIEKSFTLRIQDNGKGFNISDINKSTQPFHHGLENMKKRIKAVNGKIKIESEINNGTIITITTSN